MPEANYGPLGNIAVGVAGCVAGSAYATVSGTQIGTRIANDFRGLVSLPPVAIGGPALEGAPQTLTDILREGINDGITGLGRI